MNSDTSEFHSTASQTHRKFLYSRPPYPPRKCRVSVPMGGIYHSPRALTINYQLGERSRDENRAVRGGSRRRLRCSHRSLSLALPLLPVVYPFRARVEHRVGGHRRHGQRQSQEQQTCDREDSLHSSLFSLVTPSWPERTASSSIIVLLFLPTVI